MSVSQRQTESVMSSSISKEDLAASEIEQLHQLVLQLSKNCFEIKKLCATLLVSVGVFLAGFTPTRLDPSLFAGAGAVIICFYVLDVQSYYYQRKVRAQMRKIAQGISGQAIMVSGVGMPLEGTPGSGRSEYLRAFLNASMWFYVFLAGLDILVVVLWQVGVIDTPATLVTK